MADELPFDPNESKNAECAFEKKLNRQLGKDLIPLALFMTAWVAAIGAGQLRDNKVIRHAFQKANVPQEQYKAVKNAIFDKSGNCQLVAANVQTSCEDAKTILQVRYTPSEVSFKR